ncbi:BCCT family transporter [Aliamphritea spongicola]|uniref:BCCT family transporter n=1 Tax=Aliamphritea spongicola TaxID=707589 RepID=UPI00196B7AD0|nr:BCCT family transporter [Aliamphritea spongicola]MBN3564229.1 BCCT family transporter [Aliamphritea spongicola]
MMDNLSATRRGGFLGDYDKPLFWTTAGITLLIVALGVISPDTLKTYASNAQSYLSSQFGWAYVLALALYVGIGIWVGLSRYGNLKLGKKDDTPEFSTFTWVAMLFSCGIGVGFLLWGVAEPLYHYMQTPYMAEPATPEAIPVALQITSLHWGLHTWMGYCIVGLCIAFPAFRYGKPMNIGIALYGLLGERTEGSVWARLLDLIGAVATIGGIATVLGLGVISIDYGVNHIFGIETGNTGKVIIIALLALLYSLSAVSGLKRGVAYLSTLNVVIVVAFCVFILLTGETNTLLRYYVTGIGNYLGNLLPMTFWADPLQKSGWINWWTVFYWLIVISWSPFVGGFVARISRGRTLREFILFAVMTPTLCSMLWFAVIGGSAIGLEAGGEVKLFEAVQANVGSGIYVMLESFPMSSLLSLVVFVSMIIFLVTSADSACFFVAMQMSKGAYEPAFGMKITWGLFTGMLAIVLLLSGGLKAVQTASIVAGSPFAIGIGFMIWSLLRSLRQEYAKEYEGAEVTEPAVPEETVAGGEMRTSGAFSPRD